jgi:hypothetical protein
VDLGTSVGALALHPGYAEISDILDMEESPCPPMPMGRRGVGETVVVFVQGHAASSAAHLKRLVAQHDPKEDEETATMVVAVFDGASQREAESLKNELGLDLVAIADPKGTITDRFRVGVWPTTITLDRHGTVSDVAVGLAARRDDRRSTPDEEPHQSDAAV